MIDRIIGDSAGAPPGSKLSFDPDQGAFGGFFIARAGRSWPDLLGMLVAAAWIALVAWATANAVQASWWLVPVSLPFWATGLVVGHQILRSVTENQTIVAREDGLEIRKRSAVGKATETIAYRDIEDIGMEMEIPLNPVATFRFMNRTEKEGRVKRAVPRVVIRHRALKSRVAEHVSEAEMRWLSDALGRVVRHAVGK